MPKELFNQGLVNEPAGSDRIALSVPGVSGGKNILYSVFKDNMRVGAADFWTAGIIKTKPALRQVGNQIYLLKESVVVPFDSQISPESDTDNWISGGFGDTEIIDVDSLEEYDPLESYSGGDTYVSYVNLSSPDEQFQSPAIYRAVVDALPGQTPETNTYDPETDTGIWWYLGESITVGTSVTARTMVSSFADLTIIEAPKDRDTVGVIGAVENIVDTYVFYANATTGIKPANIQVTDPGRWQWLSTGSLFQKSEVDMPQLSSTQMTVYQGKTYWFKSLEGRTNFNFNLFHHNNLFDKILTPSYSIIIDNRDNSLAMTFSINVSGSLVWGASGSAASVPAGRMLRVDVEAVKSGGVPPTYYYYAKHDLGGGGVTAHNDLTGRDEDDSHPIGAITGLENRLTGIENQQSGNQLTFASIYGYYNFI